MSLMCKIFGNKMRFNPVSDIRPHCIRCGWQDYTLDEQVKDFVQQLEDKQ